MAHTCESLSPCTSVCICGYIIFANFLPVMLNRRVIKQSRRRLLGSTAGIGAGAASWLLASIILQYCWQ